MTRNEEDSDELDDPYDYDFVRREARSRTSKSGVAGRLPHGYPRNEPPSVDYPVPASQRDVLLTVVASTISAFVSLAAALSGKLLGISIELPIALILASLTFLALGAAYIAHIRRRRFLDDALTVIYLLSRLDSSPTVIDVAVWYRHALIQSRDYALSRDIEVLLLNAVVRLLARAK